MIKLEAKLLVEKIKKDDGIDYSDCIEMFFAIDPEIEYIDDAIIIFKILPEFNGEVSLSELLIYIPKEKRGDIKLLNKIRDWFEETAKERGCSVIKIGANFKFKDKSFSKLLDRWGYIPDTYRKDV